MPEDGKRSQPLVKMKLVGRSAQIPAILKRFRKAAAKAGWSEEETLAVINEAQSGNYAHLLVTISSHCENGGY